MRLKCLIVDDEPLAIDVLRTYVERVPALELVGSCASAVQALPYLQGAQVELLFLDINMPYLSGLEFLQTLAHQPPQVILTTAHREYALDGFEWNVVDYLLKPIAFQRFMKAVAKALPAGPAAPGAGASFGPASFGGTAPAPEPGSIFFRVDKRIVKVWLDDILYIESLKDYIRVKTTTDDLVTYQTLNAVAELLPAEQFMRVHKSYVVALSKVRVVDGNGLEVGGKHIGISRLLRDDVLARLYNTGIWGVR